MQKTIVGKKIGILGGGQLARMLALAGSEMGFEMHVYSAKATDPAALVVRHWHPGDLNETDRLIDFFKSVDVVTIESEFLDEAVMRKVEEKSERQIVPSLDHVSLFSDRLQQKSWLTKMKLPTAPFHHPLEERDLYLFFDKQKVGMVIKRRRFGYDGYGTFIIKKRSDLDGFISNNRLPITDYIVESFVPFKKELALQFVLSEQGNLTLPTVEWKAEDAKCLWVKGPIKHSAVTPLGRRILKSLEQIKFKGAIAFELFQTSKSLLINEVAPRVHNSGHHSIESLNISQFQGHIRAIAGCSLPEKSEVRAKGFAMLNLIGTLPLLKDLPDYGFHWYGKDEARPGRKMGHVTALDSSPEKALSKLLKLRKTLK